MLYYRALIKNFSKSGCFRRKSGQIRQNGVKNQIFDQISAKKSDFPKIFQSKIRHIKGEQHDLSDLPTQNQHKSDKSDDMASLIMDNG